MNRKKYRNIWLILIYICLIASIFAVIFAGITKDYTVQNQVSTEQTTAPQVPTYDATDETESE